MKANIIEASKVTQTTLTDILDNGAIEFTDNGGLYVTGYPFNFWMDADENRKLLVMYTYWHTLGTRCFSTMACFIMDRLERSI